MDTDEREEQPTPDATGVAVASVRTLADQYGTALPDVQQHAIDAHTSEQDEAEAAAITARTKHADKRDRHGNPFDPELHVTGDDGEPKLTKDGKLRMKPGRKAGKDYAGTTLNKPATGARAQEAVKLAKAHASGKMMANALIMGGIALGGEEWHPTIDERTGTNEREMLETAFGDYCAAKEMDDIPPGVALGIAVGAYALPRFTQPKTKSRAQLAWAWMKSKLTKGKKADGKRGTRSDTGNDGKRQDDAGKGTREDSRESR